ncbi:class I SAM-dependent methyltransferase [Chryseosolibacter indicus]|uniref:Class I SAM-dependent methyltransferase n=1 Tax=Chryseosolibacter indicus TaxID=2782351 RepID=A0ABS5VUE4_9BACT|nr:class I SAM-dependent methyltransferase [Chryseosolibacter indicus]MBT1705045.1 class I SAM-dependent methyltransferase [Chryseosolibacter indicus]
MELDIAINLIRSGVEDLGGPQVWSDLGAGRGLFTQALSTLLPVQSSIYAIDKEETALAHIHVKAGITLHKLRLNFIHDDLPDLKLDGAILANSLHYVKDKHSFLAKLGNSLKADARIILVEYDTDVPNQWVPYPLSFTSATKLFSQKGYKSIQKIGETISVYQRANIYASLVR